MACGREEKTTVNRKKGRTLLLTLQHTCLPIHDPYRSETDDHHYHTEDDGNDEVGRDVHLGEGEVDLSLSMCGYARHLILSVI